MNKVYTSAVVIIPPKELWEPIQKIRKLYDRQIGRWMPHINLIYPFRPLEFFDLLESKFSYVCENFKSFKIVFKDIKYFKHRHQNYSMWLSPVPEYNIKDLQVELVKIVPDCNDTNNFKNGFTPHLSIGQVKGEANLIATLKDLQDKWDKFEFLVDNICFISRENNKNSQFEVLKRIILNS